MKKLEPMIAQGSSNNQGATKCSRAADTMRFTGTPPRGRQTQL